MKLFLLSIVVLSSQAYSNNAISVVTPENCTSIRGRLVSCQENSLDLSIKDNFEESLPLVTRFETRIFGPCSTPYPIYAEIGRSNESPISRINIFSERTFNLYHRSNDLSFKVQIDSPSKNSAFYSGNCRIYYDVIGTSIDNQQQIIEAREKVANLTILLDSQKELLLAYEYLATLKPGYDLVEKIAELILLDLEASDDVVKQIKAFQTCKSDEVSGEKKCDLFANLQKDSSGRLNLREKLLLNNLSKSLLAIDPNKPKNIENYLSDTDRNLLLDIASKATEFAGLGMKLKKVDEEIVQLQIEIDRLNRIIEGT